MRKFEKKKEKNRKEMGGKKINVKAKITESTGKNRSEGNRPRRGSSVCEGRKEKKQKERRKKRKQQEREELEKAKRKEELERAAIRKESDKNKGGNK